MSWDQIESKWAAMARRVRADWKAGPEHVGVPSVEQGTCEPFGKRQSGGNPPAEGEKDTGQPTNP
jgi:hypothetical protein